MYTKTKPLSFAVLSILLACSTTALAETKIIDFTSNSNKTISVAKQTSFTVDIKATSASKIAGAAFTVTYDSSNLTLDEVNSSFFTTFTSQEIPTPGDTGYVTVGDKDYYSPLVSADTTGGTMLAAARVDHGPVDQPLFTLKFTATGNPGTYAISARQSIITNVNAGYTSDPNDESNKIPFFVGIDGDTYENHTVTVAPENALNVTVTAQFVDSDSDGIDDNWEITYRPEGVGENDADVLDYYSATGDYDQDGYSDYQEYMNFKNGETDPEGGAYDPAAKNTEGGTGYASTRISLPAVNLLLLNN